MNTFITENSDNEEVVIDVYQKLSDDRIFFIYDQITDRLATDICASLLLKDAEDPDKKITLFINSDGGDIRNVFMIYDIINIISAPIETICNGSAMQEAAILLMSGDVGMRFATKHSYIAISQLMNETAQYADMVSAKKNLERLVKANKTMMNIVAKSTGKTLKKVLSDFDRTRSFSASEAVKYGIIDKVIGK